MITDEQITKAFAGTNFGRQSPHDVLSSSLLKFACGYHTGHTALMICLELGLCSQRKTGHVPILTVKGKEYLWEAFNPNK